MTWISDNKYINLLFYGTISLLGGYLIFLGPELQPDSPGYMTYSSTRSPLYPFILKGYMAVFGKELSVLAALQIVGSLVGIHFFTTQLRKLFNNSVLVSILIFGILSLPLHYHAGRFVLTESLCYPLSLLFLSFLLKGFMENSLKDLMVAFAISSLLLLTRTQFLFLYPVLVTLIAYLYIRDRNIKSTFILILSLVVALLSSTLLERTYHYLNSGRFAGVSFVGFQLINGALYVAKPSDKDLFEDPEEKAFFQDVYTQIQEKSLTQAHVPPTMLQSLHFELSYGGICYGTMAPALSKHFKNTEKPVDSVLTSMSVKLILHNFNDWIKLYASVFIRGLGGKWFTMLICCGFLLSLGFLFNFNTPLSHVYSLLVGLVIANQLLIDLVEPPLTRYSIYTHLPLLGYLLILLEKTFRQKLDIR